MINDAIYCFQDLRRTRIFLTGYSLRRYYVDNFFRNQSLLIRSAKSAIDIGGKKVHKRGNFNIDEYNCQVKYLNLDSSSQPDFLAPAEAVPCDDASFDLLVCAELLEHVADPPKVVSEMYRVLKNGGTALVTVPFMYPYHPDPEDFGRYTRSYWQRLFQTVGFNQVEIIDQGTYFSTIANGLKVLHASIPSRKLRAIFKPLINFIALSLITIEIFIVTRNNPPAFIWNFSLGFGIKAQK